VNVNVYIFPCMSHTDIRFRLKWSITWWSNGLQWPEAIQTTNADRLLPLHVACRYTAPLQVVQCLVEQWPEAMKKTNKEEWLALHLACKFKAPLQVIEYLVEQWSEGITTTKAKGSLALDCAQNPSGGRVSMSEVISLLEAVASKAD
jgi:hypothetical protein